MTRKFKHKTGLIVFATENDISYHVMRPDKAFYIPKEVVENSNDWEEIKEEEYPVGTVIKQRNGNIHDDIKYTKRIDGLWGYSRNPISITPEMIGKWYEIVSKPEVKKEPVILTIKDLTLNQYWNKYGNNIYASGQHANTVSLSFFNFNDRIKIWSVGYGGKIFTVGDKVSHVFEKECICGFELNNAKEIVAHVGNDKSYNMYSMSELEKSQL